MCARACAPYVDFYINRVLKETERKFPRSHRFIAASIDCLGCRVKHLWLGKWKGVPNQLCFDLIFNFRSGAMHLIDFHSNWIEFPQEGRKSVSIFRPVIPTIIKKKKKKKKNTSAELYGQQCIVYCLFCFFLSVHCFWIRVIVCVCVCVCEAWTSSGYRGSKGDHTQFYPRTL